MTPEQAAVLARIDERTENMQADHVVQATRLDALAAKVDNLTERQAKIEGAIGVARWLGGSGGLAGVLGLIAAFMRGETT